MSAPVQKFRLGSVTASVWKNGDYHSVTLQRSYKEGEEIKNTDALNPGDLLNAQRVLGQALDYVQAQ